jgi:hypothetical protein
LAIANEPTATTAIHAVPDERTNSSAATATMPTRLAVTMMRRRSTRSATVPV